MGPSKKSRNEILKNLWETVDNSLKVMKRPRRLFKVHPQNSALLVIDMQNCFCKPKGAIENPDTREITPRINRIAIACRKVNIPVVWVKMIVHTGGRDAGLWTHFQPRSPISTKRESPLIALSSKSSQSQLWKKLAIDKNKDYFITKNRYSVFMGESSLECLLNELKRDTLIITGVGTNVCCESTARDAMMLGYKVVFVSDANATFDTFFHEVSLMNITLFFGDVVTTNTLLNELGFQPIRTAF